MGQYLLVYGRLIMCYVIYLGVSQIWPSCSVALCLVYRYTNIGREIEHSDLLYVYLETAGFLVVQHVVTSRRIFEPSNNDSYCQDGLAI